jgi:hypothetical protein
MIILSFFRFVAEVFAEARRLEHEAARRYPATRE